MAKKYEVDYYAWVGEHGHAGHHDTMGEALAEAKQLYAREKKEGTLKDMGYIGVESMKDDFAIVYVTEEYLKRIIRKDAFKEESSYEAWMKVANEVLETGKPMKGNFVEELAGGGETGKDHDKKLRAYIKSLPENMLKRREDFIYRQLENQNVAKESELRKEAMAIADERIDRQLSKTGKPSLPIRSMATGGEAKRSREEIYSDLQKQYAQIVEDEIGFPKEFKAIGTRQDNNFGGTLIILNSAGDSAVVWNDWAGNAVSEKLELVQVDNWHNLETEGMEKPEAEEGEEEPAGFIYNKQFNNLNDFMRSGYAKGGVTAKKGAVNKYEFYNGDVVWDIGNKSYGVVLNNFDDAINGDSGDVRLDSDGMQSIYKHDKTYEKRIGYNLVPYGSKEDGGDGDLSSLKKSGKGLIDSNKNYDEGRYKYYSLIYCRLLSGEFDKKKSSGGSMAKGGKITAKDAGNWVDGSRGIYQGEMIIEIAEKHGFLVDEKDVANKKADGEHYHDLIEESIQYLNDLAPEGYYFGNSEENSDFGLWKSDEMGKGGLTPAKAKIMLHEGKANGKKLTDKQRRYFGAVASGYAKKGKGGSADDILEFKIPSWAGSPLINGDYSGLSDEDEKKINEFVDETVKKYGNAHFSLPSDDKLELGFCHSNDIDNLGSDCIKLLLMPSKEYGKGGKAGGKGDSFLNDDSAMMDFWEMSREEFIKSSDYSSADYDATLDEYLTGVVVFDNTKEPEGRYYILNKKTGDVFSVAEYPKYKSVAGQLSHNVTSRLNTTIGYNWEKGHTEKSLRGILVLEEENWISEMRNTKDIGEEVKDLNSLPESVKNYIKKIQSDEKMAKGGKAGRGSSAGSDINWLITG